MNGNLSNWYSELTQYAAGFGVSALPPVSDLEHLFDAGLAPSEAFDTLYPPSPVTLDQSPSPAPGSVHLQAQARSYTEEEQKAITLADSITPPYLTEQDVLNRIVRKEFFLSPSASAIMCEITMQNGATFFGTSAPLPVDSLDNRPAQARSLTDAVRNAWPHEAYLFRERLYQAELKRMADASTGIEYNPSRSS